MKVMVNGEVKELEYVTTSGCDMVQDIIGNFESFPFDEDGNRIMSLDQYDWWSSEIDKLSRIGSLLEELELDNKDFNRYIKETCGCDLETQTNMQLAWLKEYRSNH